MKKSWLLGVLTIENSYRPAAMNGNNEWFVSVTKGLPDDWNLPDPFQVCNILTTCMISGLPSGITILKYPRKWFGQKWNYAQLLRCRISPGLQHLLIEEDSTVLLKCHAMYKIKDFLKQLCTTLVETIDGWLEIKLNSSIVEPYGSRFSLDQLLQIFARAQ